MKRIVRHETTMPQEMALEKSSVKVDEKTGDLTFQAIALDTKKTPNRKGFTFKWASTADVDISSLQANGRLYFMHGTWEIGIGFIQKVKVTKSQVLIWGLIPGDSRFSEEMQDSDLVKQIREVREAVQLGLLKAVSIGFYITAYTEMTGKDGRVESLQVNKLEIIETSIVTIGAHETALIQSAPGIVCEDEMAWAEEQFEDDETEEVAIEFVNSGELVTMTAEDGNRERIESATMEEVLAMDAVEVDIETDADKVSQAKQAMAKALGARGDASEDAYADALKTYTEMGLIAPAFGDYVSDKLKEIQAMGLIEIPGTSQKDEVTQKAAAVIKIDAAGLEPTIEKMSEICEKFSAMVERAERISIAPVATDADQDGPQSQCLPDDDGEALRAFVREELRGNEELCELSKLRAKSLIEQKAHENRRRIQNARRK